MSDRRAAPLLRLMLALLLPGLATGCGPSGGATESGGASGSGAGTPRTAETRAGASDETDRAAVAAVERYRAAVATRDRAAFVSSHHLPVVLANGADLKVVETVEELERLFEEAVRSGAVTAEGVEPQIVQRGSDKVHLWLSASEPATEATTPGRASLFVVTRRGDRWAIRYRSSWQPAAGGDDRARAVLASLDDYMATFNSRDPEAWAATLHFPHVRLASGGVRVTPDAAEYARQMDFAAFAERFGWDHSAWRERWLLGSDEESAHVATRFLRYDEHGELLASFDSLYVLVRRDGRWGTVLRSSFAP